MIAGLALALTLALAPPPPPSSPQPSHQEVLFFNARVALREGRSHDVLKLWLLHNAVAHEEGAGPHDDDFRSLVWAALGNLGDCPDGFPEDVVDFDAGPGESAGGAGLWQLAEHNMLLHALRRGPPLDQQPQWDAFRVARQRRNISLHDVLSKEELGNAAFSRTFCLQPYFTYARYPRLDWPDVKDRLLVGTLMKRLLEQARGTLSRKKVASTALIDARLFDLSVNLAKLEALRAKARAGQAAQLAHSVGLPDDVVTDVASQLSRVPDDSEHKAFLLRALAWKPREWLDLSPDRRIALFSQARAAAGDDDFGNDRLVTGVIDELIAKKQGAEVEAWLGFASPDPKTRASFIEGERGLRLLALDPSTGFRHRGVIALRRGVTFLEAGDRDEALRSFAYAVGHAQEARDADVTHNLALRWLTYVLAQYESTAEVVSTLQELVPRADYNKVIEELVWRAALRADIRSFDKLAETVKRGGSLDARIDDLRPLAQGNAGAMIEAQRKKAVEEPTAVLAFLNALLNELETESADVRTAQTPTLKLIADVARSIVAAEGSDGAGKKAALLLHRVDAVLEGLGALTPDGGAKERGMSPAHEAFAGAIRLAPSDALPWPFVEPHADAPSAFLPILLKPEEWRAPDGTLVFGWRITE